MKKTIAFSCVAYAIFSIISTMCMEQQIITTDISLSHHDMWNKIIACSTDTSKDALAQTCKTLNKLSRKTNHYIYTHSPLVLSHKALIFGLSCATHYGNACAVENLLNHGAEPNITIHCKILPLNIAEDNKNQQIICLLKQHHAVLCSSMPPIYAQAIYLGDLPLLNAYLESKGDSPHYKGVNNNPILHSAMINGHTHIVERLMQDPQIKPLLDSPGWYEKTPLCFAAQHNRTAITELLLKACPTMINNAWRAGFSALHSAVFYNNYHVAATLLKHPLIDVNLCSTDNTSPLHRATSNDNLEMVTLLLSAPKIDLNIINKDNETPLDLAKKLTTDDIQNLLISKGAKTFFYLSRIVPWNNK